ncbi:MAG: hypothetical protein AABW50_01755 [Nanoarchaeota archaeon]
MKNRNFPKLFEIFIGLLITFSIIAVIFAGLYYTFGFVKKSLNANLIYTDIENLIGPSDWVLITLAASFIMIAIFWFFQKKGIFQVSF